MDAIPLIDRLTRRTPRGVRGLSVKLADNHFALDAPPATKPAIDRTAMTARVVISTEAIDHSGDRVHTAGVRLGTHEKNPVVLFDHGQNGYRLPVGRAASDEGVYTVRADPERGFVESVTHFSKTLRLAEEIFQLIDEDILRGVSIGYLPLHAELMPGADPEDEDAPLDLRSIELVEYSHLPLPDNKDALLVRMQKGFGGRRPDPELLRLLAPHLPERKAMSPGHRTNEAPTMPAPAPSKRPTEEHPDKRGTAKPPPVSEVEKKGVVDDDAGDDGTENKGAGYAPLDENGMAVGDGEKGGYLAKDTDAGMPRDLMEEKPDDGPPGAHALADLHDRHAEMAKAIEDHSKRQENPAVQEEIDAIAREIGERMDRLTALYEQQYPDREPLDASPEELAAVKDEEEEGLEDEALDDAGTKGLRKKTLPPARKRLRQRLKALEEKRVRELRKKRLTKGGHAVCMKAAKFLDSAAGHEGEWTDTHQSAAGYHAKALKDMCSLQGPGADEEETKALRAENATLRAKLGEALTKSDRLVRQFKKAMAGR